LDSPLVTAYDAALSQTSTREEAVDLLESGQLRAGEDFDYLPYNADEAKQLVDQLIAQASLPGTSRADETLRMSDNPDEQYKFAPTLLDAYAFYYGQEALDQALSQIVP
jgi:hypothetical protein